VVTSQLAEVQVALAGVMHRTAMVPDNLADLLAKLHDDRLEHERSELDSCRDAINKATALLLVSARAAICCARRVFPCPPGA
jgi:hypothetical protein